MNNAVNFGQYMGHSFFFNFHNKYIQRTVLKINCISFVLNSPDFYCKDYYIISKK